MYLFTRQPGKEAPAFLIHPSAWYNKPYSSSSRVNSLGLEKNTVLWLANRPYPAQKSLVTKTVAIARVLCIRNLTVFVFTDGIIEMFVDLLTQSLVVFSNA